MSDIYDPWSSEEVVLSEVDDKLLEQLVGRFTRVRTCDQCDHTDHYIFLPGHNNWYDCKSCGAEKEIFI